MEWKIDRVIGGRRGEWKKELRDRERGKINCLVPMELCKKNPTRTTQVIPRSLGFGRIQQYGLELTSCVWCRNRKSFYFKILTHCCRQRKCHRVRFPRQGLHSLPQLGRGWETGVQKCQTFLGKQEGGRWLVRPSHHHTLEWILEQPHAWTDGQSVPYLQRVSSHFRH